MKPFKTEYEVKVILVSTLTLLIFASTVVKAEIITCTPTEVRSAAKALGQVSPKNSALALKDDLSEILNTQLEAASELTLNDIHADRTVLKKAHCLRAYLFKKMPDLVENTVSTKQYSEVHLKTKRAALNLKHYVLAHPQVKSHEAFKQRANLIYNNADVISFVLVQGQMDKIILSRMGDKLFDFIKGN